MHLIPKAKVAASRMELCNEWAYLNYSVFSGTSPCVPQKLLSHDILHGWNVALSAAQDLHLVIHIWLVLAIFPAVVAPWCP